MPTGRLPTDVVDSHDIKTLLFKERMTTGRRAFLGIETAETSCGFRRMQLSPQSHMMNSESAFRPSLYFFKIYTYQCVGFSLKAKDLYGGDVG